MPKLQRITLLTTPPTIGRYYLVPTVLYPWDGLRMNWPVFLPKHEDKEHLNFNLHHYHVDPRFVGKRGWRRASQTPYFSRYDRGPFGMFQYKPLSNHGLDHPPIVWKRMKCQRSEIPYRWSNEIAEKLTPHFIGRQCRSGKTGWICPHKRVPLGSFPAVDGVITCPLHGLQIDAETGKVVGPLATCEARAA